RVFTWTKSGRKTSRQISATTRARPSPSATCRRSGCRTGKWSWCRRWSGKASGLDQALVIQQGVAVGHAGEIIANRARPAVPPRLLARLTSNLLVVGKIMLKESFEHQPGAKMRFIYRRIIVQILI